MRRGVRSVYCALVSVLSLLPVATMAEDVSGAPADAAAQAVLAQLVRDVASRPDSLCLPLLGVGAGTNVSAVPLSLGLAGHSEAAVIPSPDYNASTHGVLFGQVPHGGEASLFAQVMLDDGLARRVTATWRTRTVTSPTPNAAQLGLRDLDEPTPSAPVVPPQDVVSEATFQDDLFLSTSPVAAEGWRPSDDDPLAPTPPAVGTPSTSPPGVIVPRQYCVAMRPVRVLERGPLHRAPDTPDRITLAILRVPEHPPVWADDPRMWAVFNGQIVPPKDVLVATYLNYGDGWRRSQGGADLDLVEHGEVVGGQ